MIGSQYFRAIRCEDCGHLAYPAHRLCGSCGSERQQRIDLSGEGELLSWTRCHATPAGFSGPIDLAIVRLDMGVSALGHLRISDPVVGMRVQVQRGQLRMLDGRALDGIFFDACIDG